MKKLALLPLMIVFASVVLSLVFGLLFFAVFLQPLIIWFLWYRKKSEIRGEKYDRYREFYLDNKILVDKLKSNKKNSSLDARIGA